MGQVGSEKEGIQGRSDLCLSTVDGFEGEQARMSEQGNNDVYSS